MIRPATHDDVDALVTLGELMHGQSPRWCRLQYSRSKVSAMLNRLIDSADGLLLVAVKSGAVVGGIAAAVTPHWSSEELVADELCFIMSAEHRGSFSAIRLICSMSAWAQMKKAVWLNAGTSTGIDPERTAQLYERLSFTRCAIGLEAYFGT